MDTKVRKALEVHLERSFQDFGLNRAHWDFSKSSTISNHLYKRLRGYTIWLYVDRAGWLIQAFLKTHRRLHLDYLPVYQPGLNLQENLAPSPLGNHHQPVV